VIREEEFERSTYVELVQFAAAMDRMVGQCTDRDLSAKLSAVCGRLDGVLEDLSERCGLLHRSPSQLVNERWRPWDKV
jgi:hypothetical protein